MSAGSFGWLELITADIPAAKAFYQALFGWEIQSDDMNGTPYEFALVNGKHVCGFDTSDGSNTDAHWLPYIAVPDTVDQVIHAAIDGGGKLINGPMDIPDVGVMAVLADPDGALFMALKESGAGDAESTKDEAWPPPVGTVSWYALAAKSGPVAVNFYSSVFGYDPIDPELLNAPEGYLVLQTGEEMHAGVFGHGGMMPSLWLVYFVVTDIESTQRQLLDLGGKIMTPAMTVPGIGRIVSVMDPQGAAFCLHQPE